ncbi:MULTISPECIES: PAS domain-containing sensor histidine kinase [unclassified Mesorhizobium]|uniref:sensor histidine kinase n=1 Tax=unclassified Mesorhizobium TaxID=325217 RepID=UPI000BB08CEF|nr:MULTISPECIES: PAS domain-containing sensor histidine kinase [unclassified Mesorhizobium]TGT60574.1 PAS domain-containing sensor histidine kinase [Mesorhizobium sp. M00.F.Ca.ET.170.01.1.1]AZO10325.1 PAS domain-containing sensor histidine kinase [Mesorhizobium sp. M3A.F.Ca.ET.080.04.2.1]PBB88156.1 alkaline phosphatase [Mesorhizobium sp. WSM3876]RWB73679.1 MAG: PAS domain-containing sensor histidine kinase [Mesorhizobium sp.]RWB91765.1 MAG: PAS domain-containing sensor histidine kinase [Mesorh
MPGEYPPSAGEAVSGGHEDSRMSGSAAGGGFPRRAARIGAFVATFVLAGPLLCAAAQAQTGFAQAAKLSVSTVEVMQLAMFAGVMGAALLSAIFLIRERARTAAQNAELRARIADVNAALQRSEALLNLRDQRVVVWTSDNKKPELIGSLPLESGAPDDRAAFLAFGRWLMPRSAAALEHAVAALREKAKTFDLVIETQAGMPLEVHGRKSAAHVLVRFISLSETLRSQARLKIENQRLNADYDIIFGLLDALKMPAWLRAADGRLKWVNRAYAEAVEAQSAEAAVREAKEFLGGQAREQIVEQHKSRAVFEQTLSTVIEGDRRMFSVTDFASAEGAAGLACDTSAMETIRAEYERTVRSHADTLDQLNTAVAIFDTDEKLRFFNQAFQKLWSLDSGFLHSAPSNAMLLDRLRSEGKIAEQPEWRRWKENLLGAYRAVESQEHWWHLPDGKTIRVVANPQPKGGVTWVFENLTEKIDLESRYQTAVRVQGETLDNLAEGVAVFGPDGRLRLSNPAFVALWGLEPDAIKPNVHVSAIRDLCDRRAADSPWGGFVAAITGFDDERRDRHGQAELVDGTVLSYAVIHLPNGQVMMTFVDVTDTVNVERALKDRNEALEKSDQLKNEFVQHVSYELRSPLTNIIGFTELLSLPATGPLTPKQREYVEHVGSSSSVLLTIVNDILDLATVDAGIMQLDISEMSIERTITAAAELVADRLEEHSIKLKVDAAAAPKSFHGDEIRIRQILYNLLSNAANYAPEASTIILSCRQLAEGVEFSVHDDGPGMPPDVLESVFRRFEPRANGGRRRGAGLGLSIVKSFVELHGGSVRIETGRDQGTTVVCTFPDTPSGGIREAAE